MLQRDIFCKSNRTSYEPDFMMYARIVVREETLTTNSGFLLSCVIAPETVEKDELLIGVYSCDGEAKLAIERSKTKRAL